MVEHSAVNCTAEHHKPLFWRRLATKLSPLLVPQLCPMFWHTTTPLSGATTDTGAYFSSKLMVTMPITSGVEPSGSAKPAMRGHFKTGHVKAAAMSGHPDKDATRSQQSASGDVDRPSDRGAQILPFYVPLPFGSRNSAA